MSISETAKKLIESRACKTANKYAREGKWDMARTRRCVQTMIRRATKIEIENPGIAKLR